MTPTDVKDGDASTPSLSLSCSPNTAETAVLSTQSLRCRTMPAVGDTPPSWRRPLLCGATGTALRALTSARDQAGEAELTFR